jgi:hypothetical protein
MKEKNVLKIPSYNTRQLFFDNYNEIEDFIIVDDHFKEQYGRSLYFDHYEIVKVWKDGRITNLKNKSLKIENRKFTYTKEDIEFTEIQVDWKYGRSKYDYVRVKEILWWVYNQKYTPESKLIIGEKEKLGIICTDGKYNNLRLDNLVKNKQTNEQTTLYKDKIKYFEFDFEIENDTDKILELPEPRTLKEVPELFIFSNGSIVDNRALSKTRINEKGYETISYKGKNFQVHRLVALCYLQNKNNYNIVNHIDGNRSNNHVKNLEWTNNTMNTLHGRLSMKTSQINDEFKSSGIQGFIPLTSLNYREFIKKKIRQELDLEVGNWIFSHKTPLFLLYLPFSREFGLKGRKKIDYDHRMKSEILFKRFFSHINKKYTILFQTNLKHSKNTYWTIVESINNYLVPKSKNDHLINILQKIGVDFNDYIDWLFDEWKILINDDTGFIFYEEILEYIKILGKNSQGHIYENDICNLSINKFLNNHKKIELNRNIKAFLELNNRIIAFDGRYHRVIEDFPGIIAHDEKKSQIIGDYERLFIWWDSWFDRFETE